MRKNRFMLAAILLLGIGFATVSTTLYLTGNVNIATNNEDFDVRFTKAVVDSTDKTSTAISPDGKTITFETKDLVTVGDKSVLDFEVTNNSTMYDAEVSINCSATGDKSSYYSIAKEVTSPIEAKTTGTGKVEVSLLKVPVNDIQEDFTCTLSATAKERTSKAGIRYIPKYFEYGVPTTASTQDYTTLGKSVFVGLDADGIQKSVCTLATGNLECFKYDNWEEEKFHIQELFSDIECNTSNSSYVECNASDTSFGCSTSHRGGVRCYAYEPFFVDCSVSDHDFVLCY